MAARVAEHLAHQHEALTGYTAEELRQAQQARGDHLAAVGWDPAAPVGSPAHPEILIDGASVSTMSGALPVEAARTRYAEVTGADALLQRNAAEAAAWGSPQMRRVRRAAELAELTRSAGLVSTRRDPARQPDLFGAELTRTTPPLALPGAPYPDGANPDHEVGYWGPVWPAGDY